jgi:hypothetical protein
VARHDSIEPGARRGAGAKISSAGLAGDVEACGRTGEEVEVELEPGGLEGWKGSTQGFHEASGVGMRVGGWVVGSGSRQGGVVKAPAPIGWVMPGMGMPGGRLR